MSTIQMGKLALGALRTNCYLLKNEESSELLIIDPASDPEYVAGSIEKLEGKPAAILLTHGHYDHIGAVNALREKYGIPVYAGEDEKELLGNPRENLSLMFSRRPLTLTADVLVSDGQILNLAGQEIQVIATPGHTVGSVCYYLKEQSILFSGDTMFCQSVGRTDFPTGNVQALVSSIQKKLLVLPDETVVCPGHEQETTIGLEKKQNPCAPGNDLFF